MQYYINALASHNTLVEITADQFSVFTKQPEFDESGFRLRAEVLKSSAPEVKAYFAAQAQAAKPKAVTARQAHEALIRKGLADNIRNAIAGIPDPVEQAVADNWFNRSNSFERDNETLKAISTAIGLTADDVDNLFAYAATL
jgi:hypothetical protein